MNKFDREKKAEQRRCLRRKRFVATSDGCPVYERPCGCPGTNYIPDGIRHWTHSERFDVRHPGDVVECLRCGATWSLDDIREHGFDFDLTCPVGRALAEINERHSEDRRPR